EQQLAEAYLLHDEPGQGQKHAERAVELGKDRASPAQLVLAKALLRQNQPELAQKALTALLSQQPAGADSQEASKLLESLKQAVASPVGVAPLSAAATGEVPKPAPANTSY